MRNLKKLAVTAAASALLASLGLAVAQSSDDPMATPQQNVDVTAPNASGQQIYFFRDQGNSPETDPAARMLKLHELVAAGRAEDVEVDVPVPDMSEGINANAGKAVGQRGGSGVDKCRDA